MKIALACDHAGLAYKEQIKQHLVQLGHEPVDFGAFAPDPEDDYPDFIRPAAEAVARGECPRGIVLGGSGNGEAMVANRLKGVRCALCWNLESAKLSRQHNDANMLSIGTRTVGLATVLAMVDQWLSTSFEGGRHERRIRKIDQPD
jgi:ribose 5-phosphate isomerase B